MSMKRVGIAVLLTVGALAIAGVHRRYKNHHPDKHGDANESDVRMHQFGGRLGGGMGGHHGGHHEGGGHEGAGFEGHRGGGRHGRGHGHRGRMSRKYCEFITENDENTTVDDCLSVASTIREECRSQMTDEDNWEARWNCFRDSIHEKFPDIDWDLFSRNYRESKCERMCEFVASQINSPPPSDPVFDVSGCVTNSTDVLSTCLDVENLGFWECSKQVRTEVFVTYQVVPMAEMKEDLVDRWASNMCRDHDDPESDECAVDLKEYLSSCKTEALSDETAEDVDFKNMSKEKDLSSDDEVSKFLSGYVRRCVRGKIFGAHHSDDDGEKEGGGHRFGGHGRRHGWHKFGGKKQEQRLLL